MKTLVTATSFKPENKTQALDLLTNYSSDIVYNPYGRPLAEDELIDLLKGCDGYIAGLDYVTESVINSTDKLKIISRYGSGIDRVDLKAAKKKGIVVCNTPGANAHAVADLAIALALACARKIAFLDKKTRQGQWVRSTGIELYSKTIGVLGLGNVGKFVAKRASGFDMNVLAYDPFIDEEYAKSHNIKSATFEEVTEQSDIISLHLPLNEKTHHIINKSTMQKMKKGAIIINTARGGLIDEEAAYELLKTGHLNAMGLDAYEIEPLKTSILFELDNVVFTPHTGSHTLEATLNMSLMSVENMIAVLSGNDCKNIVNI